MTERVGNMWCKTTLPVSQSAAWGSSLPEVEQTSIMSFILPVTSFSILRAMVKASPTPVHVYVFSFGSMGLVPKKSLFVAPLQCSYSKVIVIITFPKTCAVTSYGDSRWTALRGLSPRQRGPRRELLPSAGSPCPWRQELWTTEYLFKLEKGPVRSGRPWGGTAERPGTRWRFALQGQRRILPGGGEQDENWIVWCINRKDQPGSFCHRLLSPFLPGSWQSKRPLPNLICRKEECSWFSTKW